MTRFVIMAPFNEAGASPGAFNFSEPARRDVITPSGARGVPRTAGAARARELSPIGQGDI